MAAEIDIAAVFQLVGTLARDTREFREEVRREFAKVAGKAELADVKSEVAHLRQAVTEYHSSVVGHGILISDLEARVRRIERHLDLPPHAA